MYSIYIIYVIHCCSKNIEIPKPKMCDATQQTQGRSSISALRRSPLSLQKYHRGSSYNSGRCFE